MEDSRKAHRECEWEEFEASLPRSMEGEGLKITEVRADGSVMISDGPRSALYVPMESRPLNSREIRIVPGYTEAGYFMQAELVRLTDGKRIWAATK